MADEKRHLGRRNSAEQNRKVLERALWDNASVKKLRESVKIATGLDMKDEKSFPVTDPNFSFKMMESKALREGVSASAIPQLLRAGVQTAVNQLYHTIAETTHEQWAHVVQSDKDTELYSPLHGLSFLGEAGEGERFIESQIAGLDLKLKNRKFGELFVMSNEAESDDQTGQLQQMVSLMAEYAKLLHEIYCYGKLNSGISGTNSAYGLTIPASETKPSSETNYPFTSSSAPFVGGGYNKPASAGAMTESNIKSGIIALMNQLNLLGLKMLVNPKLLVISPHYRFDADVLMHSTQTPSGAQAAGVTGGAFAINAVKNVLTPVVSRFVFDHNGSVNADSKAWYIMDDTKPWFVDQVREPASVVQESPSAGESFDRDVMRYRLKVRMNADFIEPRFVWKGSDGSA